MTQQLNAERFLFLQGAGSYAKKKFIARYYQGDKLRGILLCQQTQREVDAAKNQLRQAQGK